MKKAITVGVEGSEDAEEENFFQPGEISRVPGGAVESGRTAGWCSSGFSRASPSCAGMKSRKPSISKVLPPSIQKEISSDGCVAGHVVQQRVEILMGSSLRRSGELTAGATGVRRIGKLKVDGALQEIDGVEPEAFGELTGGATGGWRTGGGH